MTINNRGIESYSSFKVNILFEYFGIPFTWYCLYIGYLLAIHVISLSKQKMI